MTNHLKTKLIQERFRQNPVAKYAHQFNRAKIFKDKTQYQRHEKHKGKVPSIKSLCKGLIEGFLFGVCQRLL